MIVGWGRAPAPVPEVEIDRVRRIAASGLPRGPWPYLRIGERVRVERGCLAGLQGTLARERDVFRVVVSVELLERSVAVEINRDWLSAA